MSSILPEEATRRLLYISIGILLALSPLCRYAFGRIRKKIHTERKKALLLEEDFIP